MPYDEKRPAGGIAGNLRVALPLWVLMAGLVVLGLMFLSEGDTTVGLVMLIGAGGVLVAGLAIARALSGTRAGREG
jgi:hypothetical protein